MLSNLDKLKALTVRLEDKLEQKEKSKEIQNHENLINQSTLEVSIPQTRVKSNHLDESVQNQNKIRVKVLYEKLKIFEKSPEFDKLFMYKAMNLSGISLKEDDFAQARDGKYIQIIAITYEPDKNGKKKAKNISLGYFGKADTLDETLKNEIIEFVLRWRYEKAFQHLEHYKELVARVDGSKQISATLF